MIERKYDSNNVFAKIIRGELPAKKIYEDDRVLAFHDIAPLTPIHVLVIPKGQYTDFADFMAKAPETEITHYFATLKEVATNIDKDNKGYRLMSNFGERSGQTVFHFHTHILSGTKLQGI